MLAQAGPEQTAIAWSPDGQLIASATTRENLVRVWRATSSVQLYVARGHRHWVAALAFSSDSTLLASASRDGIVRLLRAADGTLHAALRLAQKWRKSRLVSSARRTILS
jgi:WD40 repeat protein